MDHPNLPRGARERDAARTLLRLLAKTGTAVAVPPRVDIVAAVATLLRAAADDDQNRLSITERDGMITVRFARPKL